MNKWIDRIKLLYKLNIFQTIHLNFKFLPFKEALILPIFVYGKLKTPILTGKIIFPQTLKRGIIHIGSIHETKIVKKGTTQITLKGTITFNGPCFIGINSCIYVEENAYLIFGKQIYLGRDSEITCFNYINIDDQAYIGSNAYMVDSIVHAIQDEQGQLKQMTSPIKIGKRNYWGTRVIIQKGTSTPDDCIICSGSVCCKNYTLNGTKIMIGGVPAQVIQDGVSLKL